MKASSWAKTTGRVLASSVEESWEPDPFTPGGDLVFSVNIRYKYKVGGNRYESGRIGFGYDTAAGNFWPSAIQVRFPKGSKVEVSYDPTNPENSVLLTGIQLTHIVVTFMLIALGYFVTVIVRAF